MAFSPRSAWFHNSHDDGTLARDRLHDRDVLNFLNTPLPPSFDSSLPLDDDWMTFPPNNAAHDPTTDLPNDRDFLDFVNTPLPPSFDSSLPPNDEWMTLLPNNGVHDPTTGLPNLPFTPATKRTSAGSNDNPPLFPQTPAKPTAAAAATAPLLWEPASPTLRMSTSVWAIDDPSALPPMRPMPTAPLPWELEPVSPSRIVPSNATPTKPHAKVNPTSPSCDRDRRTNKRYQFVTSTPAMVQTACRKQKDKSGRIRKNDGARKGAGSGKGKMGRRDRMEGL